MLHILCRLHTTQDVPLSPPVYPSRSIKQNKRKRFTKSATIAKLASTSVAKQQPVNDVTTVTQKKSHNYYHGDDDYTFLLSDRGDNTKNAVEDVTSNKGKIQTNLLKNFILCTLN